MSFSRYPKYNPSNVEWLGEVPEHWDVLALKKSFRIVGGSTPKSDTEAFWDGEILWATPGDLSKRDSVYINDTQRKITADGLASCGTTLVPAKSIILSTRAPIGSLAIAELAMCTNQGCKSLVPSDGTNTEYFAHLLSVSTAELNVRGKGTTFLEISGDELGAFKTPVPPLAEQTAIATFLDKETARIDELVAGQRRLMELLNEQIISLVLSSMHTLETKELRLSEAAETISRPVIQKPDESYTRIGLFNRGRGLFHKDAADSDDMGESDFFWIEEGDLIISGQFAWEGAVALADKEDTGCVVSHRYPVIRGKEGIAITEYLLGLLCTKHGDFLLNENSRGATGRNRPLNISSLMKEKIPVPKFEIQQAVGRAVHARKTLFKAIARAIDLLQERRAALISTAVTGQIDVRSAT